MTPPLLPSRKPLWVEASAVLSSCTKYRYRLARRWSTGRGTVVFIGLNPSKADAKEDDPTILKCIRFAKSWGYSELCMLNLFAWRSTDPSVLSEVYDPVGPDNDAHLLDVAQSARCVVAAWGNHGNLLDRSNRVRSILPDLHGLRLNKSGEPAHPLYLPAGLKPVHLRSLRPARRKG